MASEVLIFKLIYLTYAKLMNIYKAALKDQYVTCIFYNRVKRSLEIMLQKKKELQNL